MRYLLLIVLLASCGPSHKLKKAERLIEAAIAKGAKVKQDTVYKKMTFITPKISFNTTLTDPNWADTIYVKGKDSIQVKIKRVPARAGKPETVYIETKCPERKQSVSVPLAVNQNISAGYSLWDMIILAIVCLLVGWFVGNKLMK